MNTANRVLPEDLCVPPFASRFSFRNCRGTSDISGVLNVHAACLERDSIDPYSVCYVLPNLMADEYGEIIGAAPDGATLIVEEEGMIVAHAFMETWGHEERVYLWRVWVDPKVRGLGLGTAMNRWGEAKARELHGDDDRTGLHLANASEGEGDAIALLKEEGYTLNFISPELAFDSADSVSPPAAIKGITFRFLAPSEHVAVARALCEANLNPPDSDIEAAGQDLESRIDARLDEWLANVKKAEPSLSPVAWDEDQVAGAYLCRLNGRVGEISQVAVRERWRGLGIARALSALSLSKLSEAGCLTVRLFTSIGPNEEEPSAGPYAMYKKFGFKPIARHLRYRKPMLPPNADVKN